VIASHLSARHKFPQITCRNGLATCAMKRRVRLLSTSLESESGVYPAMQCSSTQSRVRVLITTPKSTLTISRNRKATMKHRLMMLGNARCDQPRLRLCVDRIGWMVIACWRWNRRVFLDQWFNTRGNSHWVAFRRLCVRRCCKDWGHRLNWCCQLGRWLDVGLKFRCSVICGR
jgi:hypothetical protein